MKIHILHFGEATPTDGRKIVHPNEKAERSEKRLTRGRKVEYNSIYIISTISENKKPVLRRSAENEEVII